MTPRDLRMIPVAGATWGAALASVLRPEWAPGVAALLWGSSAAALAAVAILEIRHRRRKRRPELVGPSPGRFALLLPLLAVACAAAGIASAHVAIVHSERAAVAAILDGRVTDLAVTVTTKVEPSTGGVRFDGTATTPDGSARISVLLRTDDPPDGLDLGSVVSVSGGGEPADPGDAAVAVVFADGLNVRAPPQHVFAVTSQLRRGFVDLVRQGLPDPGAGLLPGLSVGETSGVSNELDADMKASSLSHLTAVSGSNCSLVGAIAFGICAACGAGRRTRVIVSLVALAGFVVLVTPEASVIRAGAMSTIALLALLTGRRGAGVAVLSLAVTVLVAADPWLATSYGFLLSASATGALLLLAEPLATGLNRWMPRALALGIAVPLAAQLVCGPIIVLFAPQVSLYGVVANMIAGPAAPAATVLGLAACLVQAIPPLALGLASLAWLPSAWVAQTAETFAALPAAGLGWHEGWLGFLTLSAIGACVVIAITDAPRRLPAAARRWILRSSVAVLALVVGAGGGTVALTSVVGPLTAPRDWSIALCDVGQGDAILLRSAGRTAIVDTGPDVDALERCLTRLGVDEIDVAFLTHFDADHVTGVPALAGRVRTIVHGPYESEDDLSDARGVSGDVREGYAGMHGALGDATWRILWPARDTRAFAPGNDTSLVVEVSGGAVPRTLLLGDLGEDAQRLLWGSGRVMGTYDVVKVSHHGSRDQSPALYAEIRPLIGLIGVGENDYGHPHPDTLALLAGSGTAVARTDTDGLVLVSAADGLSVWRER
ncbi:ComEC/Rec2 family competence protein [Microbacterium gubbeenense]|uniref:ComEC/Rec2 family competence protein n=1 Tax=Microbacterium gubbeenense TaxID=159896 RepID=UPI003F99BE8A